MAEGRIQVRFSTPDRVVAEGLYDRVVVPGDAGPFAILDRRAPIVSTLAMGVLSLVDGGKEDLYFIEDGVVRSDGNVCLIAAEEAVRRDEMDKTQVAWQLSELQKALKEAEGAEIKADIVQRIAFAQFVLEKLEED